MHSSDWHITEDVEEFASRAGLFLHSRPVAHTMVLTITEALRAAGSEAYGPGTPVLGWLERAGAVEAACLRTPHRHLNLTPVPPEHAELLASRLAGLGHRLPGVSAEETTAAAFADAWRRRSGTAPVLRGRQRLYRLGRLASPRSRPAGLPRVAGERDRDLLIRWNRSFAAAIGDPHRRDSGNRTAALGPGRRFMIWEDPDGTPVSMAGVTPVVAGQARVAPVYTPGRFRGRGYAGAVTAEVSRAARVAGATEVVLFADRADPIVNRLYGRLGYVPVADFARYGF
ncbi:GNAT family N-acetyltransferase [Streptomyces sp. MS06]|uniref:GNAT family N-acetyltransferase n=1 Tax=Streptomyces sp. MS06 TaxID=3385974 RepID=UPI00399F37EC